jgi:hypothetical protein
MSRFQCQCRSSASASSPTPRAPLHRRRLHDVLPRDQDLIPEDTRPPRLPLDQDAGAAMDQQAAVRADPATAASRLVCRRPQPARRGEPHQLLGGILRAPSDSVAFRISARPIFMDEMIFRTKQTHQFESPVFFQRQCYELAFGIQVIADIAIHPDRLHWAFGRQLGRFRPTGTAAAIVVSRADWRFRGVVDDQPHRLRLAVRRHHAALPRRTSFKSLMPGGGRAILARHPCRRKAAAARSSARAAGLSVGSFCAAVMTVAIAGGSAIAAMLPRLTAVRTRYSGASTATVRPPRFPR